MSTAVLSGVDVECSRARVAPGEFIFAKAAVVEGGGTRVRYDWSPGDTATPGRYLGEFKVAYPGGRVRTFPPVGYLHINVIPDLSTNGSYTPPDNPSPINDMSTKAVISGATPNYTNNQVDVPLLVDTVTGRLLVDAEISADNAGVESRLGATNETAAASDSATSGLNGLLKRLLGKFPALSAGRMPVEVQGTVPLPTGAATESTLGTANTTLGTINGKLPALSSGRVPVELATGFATETTLSAVNTKLGAALPLPTGAASASNQTATNTKLDTIITAVGVAPAADAATHGITGHRSPTLSSTAVAVKAGAGNVLGYTFINQHTAPVYIRFYNTAQGSTTVGTTGVAETLMVPAATVTEPGVLMAVPSAFPVLPRFTTAITMAAVTNTGDSGNTAPGGTVLAQVYYA